MQYSGATASDTNRADLECESRCVLQGYGLDPAWVFEAVDQLTVGERPEAVRVTIYVGSVVPTYKLV